MHQLVPRHQSVENSHQVVMIRVLALQMPLLQPRCSRGNNQLPPLFVVHQHVTFADVTSVIKQVPPRIADGDYDKTHVQALLVQLAMNDYVVCRRLAIIVDQPEVKLSVVCCLLSVVCVHFLFIEIKDEIANYARLCQWAT